MEDPVAKQDFREKELEPLLEEYFTWVKALEGALVKSKLKDAITYSINQEIPLRNFMLDGRLECSNNPAERGIKPFVIGRKNFLFCNTPRGAEASAVIYSLMETAKGNGLDPFRYFEYLLETLSQQPKVSKELFQNLLPWSDKLPETCKAILDNSEKVAAEPVSNE